MKPDSSKKRMIINMLANSVSYGTTLIISFVLTPYLINTLGKDAYSFYPLSNNIISYISILINGLNIMSSRYITISLSKNDIDEANTYFSSMFFSNIFIVLITIIPMVLIVVFINQILSVPVNLIASVRTLFSFSFASLIVNIIFANYGIATFAKNRIDLRSIQDFILSIIRIILIVFFFTIFPSNIAYIGIIAFIITILMAIFQYIFTRKLTPELKLNIKKFNILYVKEVFISGIWNSLNTLGNILLASTTLILVNIYYGSSAAGEYSIVQIVPNFINGLISMLTGVFFPMIMINFARSDTVELMKSLKKAQSIVGTVAVTVIGLFIGFSSLFFHLWVPKENSNSLFILSTITILPHILIGCMWPLNSLNIAMNKIKLPAIFLIITGFLNIIISYICFKYFDFGLISLVITSTVLQIIWIGIFMPNYASKNLNIKYTFFYPLIIKVLLCGFLSFFIALMVVHIFYIDNWIVFIFLGSLSGIISLFINSIIIIGYREILEFLKIKNYQ